MGRAWRASPRAAQPQRAKAATGEPQRETLPRRVRDVRVSAMKSQPINRIRKRFHREWLLIAVQELDRATTTPKRGRLLAHHPNREQIYEAMLHHKGLALVTFSDDRLPAGYAVAF